MLKFFFEDFQIDQINHVIGLIIKANIPTELFVLSIACLACILLRLYSNRTEPKIKRTVHSLHYKPTVSSSPDDYFSPR